MTAFHPGLRIISASNVYRVPKKTCILVLILLKKNFHKN